MTYEPRNLKLWTMPEDYFGAVWPATYRAGFGQHRDSDALARSNFATALNRLGGESGTVTVVREGHWAVGWIEWIAIHQDDEKALAIADYLNDAMEDYPVLDDEHFSDLETEEANEIWSNCYSAEDRIDYIRRNRDQFEFHDFGDLIGCVRGKYFAGYASELIR